MNKLYTSPVDSVTVLAQDVTEARAALSKLFGKDCSKKQLTEIQVPPGQYRSFYDDWDELIKVVNDQGEVVFTWDNESSVSYPEDLTWDRMIRLVFEAGFKLGKAQSNETKK